MHGIDEQVRTAEDAVAGRTSLKPNRFVQLTGPTKAVNRDLETKARALAGIKGYVRNIKDPNPQMLIGPDRRLL